MYTNNFIFPLIIISLLYLLLAFAFLNFEGVSPASILYQGGDVTYTTPSTTNNNTVFELRVDALSPRTASSNPVNAHETLAYACTNHVGMGGRLSFHTAEEIVIDVVRILKLKK